MSATPTVVLVDDAAEVRELVRIWLEMSGEISVVGEGSNGAEAVERAHELHPSLMLLDVSMPVMDGLEALPQVLAASPGTRVVLYSGFEEQGLLEKALGLGASAFLKKSAPIEQLSETLLSLATADDPEPPPPAPAPQVTQDQHVLDEHSERFREVFEAAAIGMATMTLSGNIVRANPALGDLLHCSSHDLVGTFYGGLTDGQGERVRELLEEARTTPVKSIQLEHEVPGLSRQAVVLATFAPVRDSLGRPLYVFLQVQDVTAERQANAELRKSEERFRLLVENVEDYAIFMLDPDGRVASWNAGAQRSKGYTADEIIGQHFRVFYPHDVAARRHPEHELDVALREGHYDEEGWRIRKDGSRYWAYVVITPVRDAEGRHVGFAKVTRDMTEIRASEHRFKLLVDSVEDYAIFMLDPDGVIVSWNAGAQRNKGWTADEIIGQHFRVFYPQETADAGHPEHELAMALKHGHYEEEGWRVRKDGTRFWANVVITAVYDPSGEHVGYAKVTRDTSERRRLEDEREDALDALASANAELGVLNRKLQQASNDQSQFLGVTAHELRTPVGLIKGSAHMLSAYGDRMTDEDKAQTFEAIDAATIRLSRLVDDLLTASRLQHSKLTMRSEAVAVAAIVEGAVDNVRRASPTAEVVVAELPAVDVLGDRDRLSQAVENLLSNALKHGAPPVEVSASVEDGAVAVRVADHGPGPSEAMRPRLFERFATGMEKGGTGLGLFIVRELARAHGGDAVYEPPGENHPLGSFTMTLPLAERPEAPGTSEGR